MSNRIKYIVLTIGMCVFGYLVYQYGIGNILLNLKKTGWWFILILLVWAVVYFFNALSWYVILRNHNPEIRLWHIYRLTIAAFSLNYVTPFLSLGGEPYRAAALQGYIDRHRAISSVISYNMIRWLAHFSFWLSAILLAVLTVKMTPALDWIYGSVCLVVMGLAWFFLSRYKKGILESLLSWMEGKPLLRRFWQKLAPHRPAILIIDEQIRDLYINQRTTFYASILFEYLSRIVGSFEFYFILKALGYHPTFLEALYINAATSFILNMLFFVPFELGTREGGMFLVLQSIGYTQGIGIFLGLVTRLREFFWIAIGMAAMLKSEAKPETEKSILTMIEREERP